jgi:hemoglobin
VLRGREIGFADFEMNDMASGGLKILGANQNLESRFYVQPLHSFCKFHTVVCRRADAHGSFDSNVRALRRIKISVVDDQDVFAAIGEEGFERLVAAFYRQVPFDEVLSRLYPQDDLAGAETRLREFLVFRFGGPPRYIENRGHPRLRMRHAPFAVDRAAHDHWMALMRRAMEEAALPHEVKQILSVYFESAAAAMINREG